MIVPNDAPRRFNQCDCGAYRLAVQRPDGVWTWAAGCRACDRIERLEQLLGQPVRIRRLREADR